MYAKWRLVPVALGVLGVFLTLLAISSAPTHVDAASDAQAPAGQFQVDNNDARLIEFSGSGFCDNGQGYYEYQIFNQTNDSVNVRVEMMGEQIWAGTLGPKGGGEDIYGGAFGSSGEAPTGVISFFANGIDHGHLNYALKTGCGSSQPTATPTPVTPTAVPPQGCAPNPKADLAQSFVLPNDGSKATIINTSATCEYDVPFASYTVYEGGSISSQTLFDVTMTHVGKNSRVEGVSVNVPLCYWQSDLFFGDVIQKGPFYNDRLLDAGSGGSYFCTLPTPTPPAMTPSATATPPNTVTSTPTATVPGKTSTATPTKSSTATPTKTPGKGTPTAVPPTNTATPPPGASPTITPVPATEVVPTAMPSPSSVPGVNPTPQPPSAGGGLSKASDAVGGTMNLLIILGMLSILLPTAAMTYVNNRKVEALSSATRRPTESRSRPPRNRGGRPPRTPLR